MGAIFNKADILLPKPGVDLTKWTVIACDQFTSDQAFWARVEAKVGAEPSTLHMILPEAWLGQVDEASRTKEINGTMHDYLEDELFEQLDDSLIYVERTLKNGKLRRGVVGAIDLEQYDISPDSSSALRGTERIIASRLPARVDIRRAAALELPHVLILIDDPTGEIIEGIPGRGGLEQVYDFDLMEGCGHLRGYRLTGGAADQVTAAINALPVILVGDGNHSLVAAKMAWDERKVDLTEVERQNHPARFALVEINNVHEESLEIEPIHRIVFDAQGDLIGQFAASSPDVVLGEAAGDTIRYIDRGVPSAFTVQNRTVGETIDLLQVFLDEYVEQHGGEIDYIHGDAELEELAAKPDSIAFFMPPIAKPALFESVVRGGVFPKKSFSMGEGADKRHYLECRVI
ncbi:MAG: DUF1015 domain-containing protein [Oscillospiraceae bacterium]|nr:DUF1015 domain-containing protein [Oscillospiraceae bacterium]